MARPLRIEYEGAVYHITARGNEKKLIFRDDKDRLLFFDIMNQVKKRYNWLCHTYCLMNNHYHLVIETPDANLSKGMRQLNGVYTQAFNKKHKRVGHVLQGRYKAILIQKESYLLEVIRYVVLNPLRAKVAQKPEGWKWSSYRSIAGKEKAEKFLIIDWILGQFGNDRTTAQKRYCEFVKEGTGQEPVWKKVEGQGLLGGDKFVEELLRYVKGNEQIKEIPRKQRYIGRPGLDVLFKDSETRQQRNKRIIGAVESYGYSQKEVADCLGMHYSTVSRLMKSGRGK
jgi:REP element-mobilizing transposase RayT